MRGVLPIIAALAMFIALVIATTYFVTANLSTIINTLETGREEKQVFEEELRSIVLTALRTSSEEASMEFLNKFVSNYQEWFFEGITIMRRVGGSTLSIKLYNYDDYNGKSYNNVNCGVNITCINVFGSNEANYNLRGYLNSLNSFVNALAMASQSVANRYRVIILRTLDQWINIRRQFGYTIEYNPDNVIVYYMVDVKNTSTIGSISLTNLTVYLSLDIYSPWSGYMRIYHNLTILVNTTFYRGWRDLTGLFNPVNIMVKIYVNNVENNYIVNPDDLELYIYSKTLNRLPSINSVNGSARMNVNASFYRGNGVNEVIFKLPFRDDKNIYTLGLEAITGLSLAGNGQNADDDVFKPPESANVSSISNRIIDRHSMVFLWAGLMRLDIDGINLHSGIVFVFKYFFDTSPGIYDWFLPLRALYGHPTIPVPDS
ncbi:MAG: hypothetical protein QXU13_01790 [Desulfurococcaceae archaeon]